MNRMLPFCKWKHLRKDLKYIKLKARPFGGFFIVEIKERENNENTGSQNDFHRG